MKILLYLNWGLPETFVGGTERFVINLAKGINQRGDEAFIVCSNLEDKITIEGINVFGIVPEEFREKIKKYGYANENFFREAVMGNKFSDSSIARLSRYTSKQITNFNFDIIHLNAFLYSLMLPKEFPFSKTIVTNHENPQELDNYWGPESFSVLSNIAKSSSSFRKIRERVVPSEHYAKLFSKSFGIPVSSIPLGIDTTFFSHYTKNEKLRKEHASPKDIVILLPSRFDIKQKGHDIAIKALSILKKRGVPIKGIFSGYDKEAYGGNLEEFNSLIKEENLEGNIILTKFDIMSDAYGICDIVISPERFCSYGLAISESLALGLPTVLSPIPTYKEIASGYKHAHFTNDHSPEALAQVLLNVINSSIGIDHGEALRFKKENSFERCVDKYYRLYSK